MHQPALGVGVGHLAGAAAVVAQHVAGPHRVAAHGVLGGGDEAGDPDRAADRGERAEHGDDDPAAGHVALHGGHRLGGLDGQATGVEGDALADEDDREASWTTRRAACSRGGSGRTGWPSHGRRRRCRRSRPCRAWTRPRPRLEAGLLGQRHGLLGQPARALEVGGHGGQHPGAPAGAARRRRPGAASRRWPRRCGCRRAPPGRPAAGAGPLERQWKPKEPSIVPTTKGSRPSGPVTLGIVVATPCRSRTWRASAAPARRRSIGRASPTPTRSTNARSGLSGLPPGTSTLVTSPVLPVALAISQEPSRSSPVRSLSASAPGPRRTPSSPGSTGSATTSTPLRACGSAPLKANCGGRYLGWERGCRGADGSATGVSRRRP